MFISSVSFFSWWYSLDANLLQPNHGNTTQLESKDAVAGPFLTNTAASNSELWKRIDLLNNPTNISTADLSANICYLADKEKEGTRGNTLQSWVVILHSLSTWNSISLLATNITSWLEQSSVYKQEIYNYIYFRCHIILVNN